MDASSLENTKQKTANKSKKKGHQLIYLVLTGMGDCKKAFVVILGVDHIMNDRGCFRTPNQTGE
jgi:hypothetical protein